MDPLDIPFRLECNPRARTAKNACDQPVQRESGLKLYRPFVLQEHANRAWRNVFQFGPRAAYLLRFFILWDLPSAGRRASRTTLKSGNQPGEAALNEVANGDDILAVAQDSDLRLHTSVPFTRRCMNATRVSEFVHYHHGFLL